MFFRRLTLALLTIMFSAVPAHSQSVIQFSGQTICGAYNSKSSLTAADLAAFPGAIWLPFVPLNGDQEYSHYSISSNGFLLWNAPDGSQQANPETVEDAIFSDPALAQSGATPGADLQVLLPFRQYLDRYNTKTAEVQAIYQTFIKPALSAAGVTELESDCSKANMPLVATSPSAVKLVSNFIRQRHWDKIKFSKQPVTSRSITRQASPKSKSRSQLGKRPNVHRSPGNESTSKILCPERFKFPT